MYHELELEGGQFGHLSVLLANKLAVHLQKVGVWTRADAALALNLLSVNLKLNVAAFNFLHFPVALQQCTVVSVHLVAFTGAEPR